MTSRLQQCRRCFAYLVGNMGLVLGVCPQEAEAQQMAGLYNRNDVVHVQAGAILFVRDSVINTSGATLHNAGTLLVGRNFTNTGTLNSPGRLLLVGNTVQRLSAGTGTVSRLQIRNTAALTSTTPAAVTVPTAISITDSLILTSGLVRTTPNAAILLQPEAYLAGERDAAYVQGNLRVVQPLDGLTHRASNGLQLVVTGPAPAASVVITRTAGLQQPNTSYGFSFSGNKGIDALWTVPLTITAANAVQVSLNWFGALDNGLTDFSRAQAWARITTQPPWQPIGPPADASANRQLAVSFSGPDFPVQWTVSSGASPLPVTLVSFEAKRQDNQALLRWQTASELNNAYFEVQSSADGYVFSPIGRVSGHGTSATGYTYQFFDAKLITYASSLVYYRLRQVDEDNTEYFSDVRTVSVPPSLEFAVHVYPNPSTGAVPTVLLQSKEQAPADFTLLDAAGRLLSHERRQSQTGAVTFPLTGLQTAPAGVYFLRVRQGQQQQVLIVSRH